MIDFFYIYDDKELKDKLALTESSDLVQYIYNLDLDKEEIFLHRLEKIFGETHTKIIKEAVKYFEECKNIDMQSR